MKLSIKIILAFALFALSASDAFSCSCGDQSVRQKFRSSNSIFMGQVVEMSPFHPNDDFPLAISLVKFKVEKQWKGSRQSEITGIADFDSPGMCGDLNLAVGKRYLIYALRQKGRLHIYTDCGPNRNAEYAEDEVRQLKSFWFRLFARVYPYPKV